MTAATGLSACGAVDPPGLSIIDRTVDAVGFAAVPFVAQTSPSVADTGDVPASASLVVPRSPLDLEGVSGVAARNLPSRYSAPLMIAKFRQGGSFALMIEPDDSAVPRDRDSDVRVFAGHVVAMPKDTLASELRSAASHASDATNHRLDFTHGQVILNISDTVYYRLRDNEIVCRWRF